MSTITMVRAINDIIVSGMLSHNYLHIIIFSDRCLFLCSINFRKKKWLQKIKKINKKFKYVIFLKKKKIYLKNLFFS